MAELDPIRILKWRVGRPADIWLSNRDLIASFIKKYNIKPLEVESYPDVSSMPASAFTEVAAATTTTKSKSLAAGITQKLPWPKPFPGGMRVPHLHFGPDVYILDRLQWKEFSGAILRETQERLGKAKEISFEQTLELTQAIHTLG